jgi:hypothetical protein
VAGRGPSGRAPAGDGAAASNDLRLARLDLIPLWLKIAYTLFLCVLVPVYWIYWGPKNFLWFSDIALLTTAVALWLESSLLASMMTLAIALPELAWNADFFGRLVTGRSMLGLSGYMFDHRKPLPLRALSLFHVVLPIVLVWMVYRIGYDGRAWVFQTVVALIVLPLSYWLSDAADNINWVYGPGNAPQTRMKPLAYLALTMTFFPLVIYLPTHLLLRTLFGGG